ncbi:MAG: hypothetical protein KJZ86_10505 [Caldilineaceae bacterium]|nr:hypothetical protein [Caldilineaceae bacterium]
MHTIAGEELKREVSVQPPHPTPPHSREGSGATPPPQWGRLGGGEQLQQERWLLSALLVCHLLLALAYSWANPLGEAPDEADHWAYIVYLAQERSLPVGPTVTQSKHPPFYHASAALLAGIFAEPSADFLRANPDLRVPTPPEGPVNFFIHTSQEVWPLGSGPLAFHLARLWSILLSLGTIVAAYGLVRAAFPNEKRLALAVAGVLAFLPTFAFIGSAASNDGPAAFFAAAALWGAFAIARANGSLRAGWWTPLALGLGLLTKVSTVAVWLPVALILYSLPTATPTRRRFVAGLPNLLAVFLPAGLIAGPWFWRNWQLYGDPMGLELARQTIDQRLTPWGWADSWWLVKGWFLSFWGRFGAIGQIAQPRWMDWLLLGLTVLAGLGLARLWRSSQARATRPAILLLLVAVLATAGVMGQYSLIALGTDQGRLLYPALVPIVALWVLGLRVWLGRAGVLVAATALWGIAILAGVILPAYSPGAVIRQPTAAARAAALDFGEIQLRAVEMGDGPVLYWTATARPVEDLRVVLRVTAEDGTLIWEWQRSPGEGRYATDRWSPGQTVRDSYAIDWPAWAGPGRYRAEVGVRAFAGRWLIPSQAGEATANEEHPFVQIGWIEYK